MKLDLSHIPESGLKFNVELDVGEVDMTGTDADLAGNLRLEGRVLKAGEEMVLDGVLRGGFSLTCSRCLKQFVQPFEFAVSATYVETTEFPPGARTEVAFDDDTRIAFLGDEIDLIAGIREDLMLNVPLKPLCSDDCRGLCPQCGADLNEEECGCAQERGDPRLASLRAIRTQIERGVEKQP
jgi:uncharacterized protein